MIQELSFGIFFLYFVIMSSVSFKLLNCNLQRFLVNNVWVKQLFVFFSIFLFTFILRWYSLDPLDN